MARSLVSTLHTNSVVQTSIGAGPTLYPILGIEDYHVDPKIQDEVNRSGGDHRPSHIFMESYAPEVTWSCSDLANALAHIDHLDGKGVGLAAGGLAGDFISFYFVKKQHSPTVSLPARLAGSVHTQAKSFTSYTFLEEITAQQGSHAVARFRTVTAWDATNEPIIFAGSSALPSGISNLTEMFKLGKWDIQGSNIDGVIGMTYRTGITVDVTFAGGDHRPSFISQKTREPVIELTTTELPLFTTLTPAGAKGTTAVAGYLYKTDETGNVTADATATHLKFTCSANSYRNSPGAITVRQNENLTWTVMIKPMHDGSLKEVVLSTASAVS